MTPSSTPLVPLTLFVISFVCLGSWVITFKLAGKRWRYELFSLDFALGTVLFSCLIAVTVGNMGPDLPVGDRLILSSKTAQALVLSAGFIFGLANLLLMGAVSVLGIAGTFPLCVGLALIVNAILSFRSYSFALLLTGLAFLVFGVLLDAGACRARDLAIAVPPKKALHQPSGTKGVRSLKGLIVAFLAGILLGVVYPLLEGGLYGDLGLGAYAGLLFFCAGTLVSTLLFSILSFNIPLEGTGVNVRSYLAGSLRQHLSGMAGGAIWGAGALAAFFAVSAPNLSAGGELPSIVPLASALLALVWGALVWKEFAVAPGKAQLFLTATAALLAGGFWLLRLAHLR